MPMNHDDGDLRGLGPDAQALVEAGRAADHPSPMERARIRRALLTTVAGSASIAAATSTAAASAGAEAAAAGAPAALVPTALIPTATTAAAASAPLFAAKVAATVLVLGAATVGTVQLAPTLLRSAPEAASTAEAATAERTPRGDVATTRAGHDLVLPAADEPSAPVAPTTEAEARPTAPRSSVEMADDAPSPRARPRRAARRAAPVVQPTAALAEPHEAGQADDLAAELALVRQARSALGAGRVSAARRALDDHGRRFPAGVLAQERDALRAITACRAGEGPAAGQRFVAAHPRSPHVDRVRTACLASDGEQF